MGNTIIKIILFFRLFFNVFYYKDIFLLFRQDFYSPYINIYEMVFFVRRDLFFEETWAMRFANTLYIPINNN